MVQCETDCELEFYGHIILCRYYFYRWLPLGKFKENRDVSPKTVCVGITTKYKVKNKQSAYLTFYLIKLPACFYRKSAK